MTEESIAQPEQSTTFKAGQPDTTPAPKPTDTETKIKLSEEDKEKFFKAFLSDTPFQDEAALFNGKLIIGFKTLSLEENQTVFTQINYDYSKGIAKNDDSYIVRIVQYRLAASLVSINGEDFCPEINAQSHPDDSKEGSTFISKKVDTMKAWNTFKLGAITDAFNKFEAKVKQLTEESFQENF